MDGSPDPERSSPSMNKLENWFCATSFWQRITEGRLLPWLLEGEDLGEHLLEIGAGAGAATPELCRRARRVTSVDYSREFAVALAAKNRWSISNGASMDAQEGQNSGTGVVQKEKSPSRHSSLSALRCDAARLPFASGTFSSAIAVLVLHHLLSEEQQDLAFAEIHRVLRPGGIFLALEIADGILYRLVHVCSTFTAVSPASIEGRMLDAGFSQVRIGFRRGAFCVRALRASTV